MSYWAICVTIAITSFVVTEVFLRMRGKKFVNVSVKDKSGQIRIVRIRAGKDPEVDALISSIKERRAS